jgi:hypothetical protein
MAPLHRRERPDRQLALFDEPCERGRRNSVDEGGHLIEFHRAFIRSGVRCTREGSIVRFEFETRANIDFVAKVLACAANQQLTGTEFHLPAGLLEEDKWLACWERLHGGAEGGRTGFEGLELDLMDTYMAGVVRWLNALGVRTHISCDGHRRRAPYIEVMAKHQPATAELISWGSSERLVYDGRYITRSGQRRGRGGWPARQHLLDLAERLHERAMNEGCLA